MKKTNKIMLLILFLSLISNAVYAEIDQIFLGVGPNVVVGPSDISVHNTSFGLNNSHNQNILFNLADDGRFSYTALTGIRFLKNFGSEFQYINLGSQHLIGVNGSSLDENSGGYFTGYYYGLDASYFIPIHQKNEIFFSIGAGQLQTNLDVSYTNGGISSTSSLFNSSQREAVLYLGGGLLIDIYKHVSIDIELSRLTPVTHGLLHSGTYNTGFTALTIGCIIKFENFATLTN